MDILSVFLNETNCSVVKNNKVIWSEEKNFFECKENLLQSITQKKCLVDLILDHFWIKTFHFHLEEPLPELTNSLIKTQITHHSGIPEELLSCQIIDTLKNNDTLQGTVLYMNKQELKDIQNAFTKKHILINKIYNKAFPQLLFFNRKIIIAKKNKLLKKILFTTSVLLLIFIILFSGNFLLDNKLKNLARFEFLYLKALKENHILKEKHSYAIASQALRKKGDYQKEFITKFLHEFPNTLPHGLYPKQIILDFSENNLLITGSGENMLISNIFLNKLSRLDFIKKPCFKKVEQSDLGINFMLKAFL